ncbi:phosphoribosyltransferase [Candidatus Kaiserbacteria bacterium]|nr:phosphoribosyltransferase [Candidatus Kaiserbacteria bacterium]
MERQRFERPKVSRATEKLIDREDSETLERLEKSVASLVSDMKERINGAEYELVIGEDASGRLPALMLGTVLKDVYESRGIRAPMVRFLTSSRPTKESGDIWEKRTAAVREALSEIKKTFDESGRNGKVLLVTDVIDTGNSMEGLLRAVQEAGMAPEVATVALLKGDSDSYTRAEAFEKHWGVNVYWTQNHLTDVFRNRLSGVTKSKDGAYAVANDRTVGIVRAARERVINAAHRIAADFIAESPDGLLPRA